MMSGDGLLVRVHPRLARLTAGQVVALCGLAQRFGNGMIDITSRANLQIRGVSEAEHPKLLQELISANLVEADPKREAQRTITVTPFWESGDLTTRLVALIAKTKLPDLPGKMGVLVDAGSARALDDISGDFRFETSATGGLILRADGATMGRSVDEATAAKVLREMADWFVQTGGAESGRMARHLKNCVLPEAWRQCAPANIAEKPEPNDTRLGVPFGQIKAADLVAMTENGGVTHLRITPWRMILLEGGTATSARGFLTEPHPLLSVDACPGAPACAQSSVPTRALARKLAAYSKGRLHVSGCAKGCARQKPCDVTLVGRDGRFDLVKGGRPGDTPAMTSLSETEIVQMMAGADAF